ncbi:MAG: hypothetical protein ACU84J_11860 [Gammaproteobacteria bacterium]
MKTSIQATPMQQEKQGRSVFSVKEIRFVPNEELLGLITTVRPGGCGGGGPMCPIGQCHV